MGPPGGLDWSAKWHEILHEWNARVFESAEQAGVNLWSRRCLEQYWKLTNYIANLPDNRWVKRALAWTTGRAKIGRPRHMGLANTHALPMEMFGRMAHNSNADRCIVFFSFFAPFWTAEVSGFWTVLLGSLQACGRKGVAISIPVAPALQGRWPSPSQSSLTRGWEAARLGGWAWVAHMDSFVEYPSPK